MTKRKMDNAFLSSYKKISKRFTLVKKTELTRLKMLIIIAFVLGGILAIAWGFKKNFYSGSGASATYPAYECQDGGRRAVITLSADTNAKFAFRYDKGSGTWNGNCQSPNEGDQCNDNGGSSFTVTTTPGEKNTYWAHPWGENGPIWDEASLISSRDFSCPVSDFSDFQESSSLCGEWGIGNNLGLNEIVNVGWLTWGGKRCKSGSEVVDFGYADCVYTWKCMDKASRKFSNCRAMDQTHKGRAMKNGNPDYCNDRNTELCGTKRDTLLRALPEQEDKSLTYCSPDATFSSCTLSTYCSGTNFSKSLGYYSGNDYILATPEHDGYLEWSCMKKVINEKGEPEIKLSVCSAAIEYGAKCGSINGQTKTSSEMLSLMKENENIDNNSWSGHLNKRDGLLCEKGSVVGAGLEYPAQEHFPWIWEGDSYVYKCSLDSEYDYLSALNEQGILEDFRHDVAKNEVTCRVNKNTKQDAEEQSGCGTFHKKTVPLIQNIDSLGMQNVRADEYINVMTDTLCKAGNTAITSGVYQGFNYPTTAPWNLLAWTCKRFDPMGNRLSDSSCYAIVDTALPEDGMSPLIEGKPANPFISDATGNNNQNTTTNTPAPSSTKTLLCGSDNGKLVDSKPTSLCQNGGQASSVSQGLFSDAWKWDCSLGGKKSNCVAYQRISTTGGSWFASESQKVDGQCGSDNGKTLSDKPAEENRCSAGRPSGVRFTEGTWRWACFGYKGKNNATCSARR